MRRAGIYAPDPVTVHDARGRLLYCNFGPLRENLFEELYVRPPLFPFSVNDRSEYNGTLYTWKGKEYLYSKCKNQRWIGYYPVMFHGHVTHSKAYIQAFEGSLKQQRKASERTAPSHLEVYALLSKNEWRLGDDL